MTTQEALETRPWFRESSRIAWRADAAAKDFERALRKAYGAGYSDGTTCTNDGRCACSDMHGVTAGVEAIIDEV